MNFNVAAAEIHRTTLSLGSPFGELELKAAYRKLIKQWHPDHFMSQPHAYAEATEKAKSTNIAYEFLSELLERNGGPYWSPSGAGKTSTAQTWTWEDLQPRRTYEGKTYTVGFPDPAVTEIFLKSSHIVSTGYSCSTQTLYIKFSGNSVYRYFNVPETVFEDFLNAPSHGKFGHQHIYQRFRYERC